MKIEGYFGNMKAAGSAVEKLKQQGFKAFIDINEERNDDRNLETALRELNLQ